MALDGWCGVGFNAKAKGSRAEHKTIARLEAQGYKCTRAAGSMGAWDIIAVGETHVRLIQCKCNKWPGSTEMATLRGFRCPANVTREVWRWNDYQREPQVKSLDDNVMEV